MKGPPRATHCPYFLLSALCRSIHGNVRKPRLIAEAFPPVRFEPRQEGRTSAMFIGSR